MKETVLRMIEDLSPHGKNIVHHALIGMTGGYGTTEEMLDELDDKNLTSLFFFLQELS